MSHPRHALLAVALLLAALALPRPALAQRPAELVVRVVDALAGRPLEGVRVTLREAAPTAVTDAAGVARIDAVDAGLHTLLATRLGYADTLLVADVARGRTTELWIALRPLPQALDGLVVTTGASEASMLRISRAEIERSGARTAGDVLAGLPGVLVREAGAGAEQTVSVRGGDPSQVLVLVDGTPLNDPVTGVADLSALSAQLVESIEVLPGARSAAFGPRAAAGVVLVRTRAPRRALSAEAALGSLGARELRVEAGGAAPFAWSAGGSLRRVGGGFDFDMPPEVGGGRARRANADAGGASLFAALTTAAGGGTLRARASGDGVERGLPGKSFAPSPEARETRRSGRGTLAWERAGTGGRLDARIGAAAERLRLADPYPPFGLAYDDTTRALATEAALSGERTLLGGALGLGGGAEARRLSIHSTRLSEDAPTTRWEAAVSARAEARVPLAGGTLAPAAHARLDRDPAGGPAVGSHALSLAWTRGRAALSLAHRSAFSPPGLEDQFFKDAVGVEPNPDLRAERVPGEVEARLAYARPLGRRTISASLAAHAGDVLGMIVWAPDYRFVWSPRNVDVIRRGLEATFALESPDGPLRALRGSWTLAHISYAGGGGGAQLEYRPRHTAHAQADLRWLGWDASLRADYTGVRYPAAARVNALSAFWTPSVSVSRGWRAGALDVRTQLRVDRLLGDDTPLIYGFPDPGRVAELRVRVTWSPPQQGSSTP